MVFDRHVLTLDITCFAEGVAERGHIACHRIGRPEVYEPDDGHRRLLRAPCERPRCCRATEQRDELAPFHCPIPPVLRTERIAYLGTVDCCIHPPGRNEMIAITLRVPFRKAATCCYTGT